MISEFSKKVNEMQLSSTTRAVPQSTDNEAYQVKELELKNMEIELLKQKNELLERERNFVANNTASPTNGAVQNSTLLFRDVEDAMVKFTGENEYPVERWISDVEGVAKTCGWSDIQTVTYGKRLLDGCAKKALRTTSLITSWNELKAFLIKEFTTVENTAVIHKRLASRKRKSGESCRVYLLELMEIAHIGKIEEAAIIQYCIDGIDGYNTNKIILYGANNMEEFKKKLKVYEELVSLQKPGIVVRHSTTLPAEPEPKKDQFRNKPRSRQGETNRGRCYSCNEMGHVKKECRNKENGPKCYKCNVYGHLASKCPTLEVNKNAAAMTTRGISQKNVKYINIGNHRVLALVDSGSDLNLMSKRKWEALKLEELQPVPTKFYGVGSGAMETLGQIECDIMIDGEIFATRFHVAADGLLPCEVIIGNELLNDAVTILSPDNITIRKFVPYVGVRSADIRDDVVPLNHVKDQQCADDIRKAITNYDPKKGSPSGVIKMKIVLSDETPIYQKPRRLALAEQEIVRRQIQEWIRDGIVRISYSPFASPVVLVNKKDGTKRLCVDYRRINRVIVKDRYPMPLIDDQIDKLYAAKYFCTLDLKNGFFHVDIADESVQYTSFVTSTGQYEFLKVPFGLCNSPAVFGRYINHVFRQLCLDGIVCVYMDDLIVHGGTEEESVEKLKKVLKVAEANCLQIKWEKCQFLVKRVEYLGYEIEDSQVRPSTGKRQAISKFPAPTTVLQLQRFLGLTGYFRRFVEGYSTIAKPLSDLLRKKIPFKFGPDQHRSFIRLKEALITTPVLQIYSGTARTELHTDASKVGLAAVLLQAGMEDDHMHPVFYYSRKTTPCEEKYSSYELEALAVVRAVKKFRVYLLGLQFKIVTDCAAFKGTLERKEFTSRIAGWALYLQEFNYQLEHRAATRMKHVDALSRAPVVSVITSQEVTQRVKAAQMKDENLRLICQLLDTGPYKSYYNSNGVLFINIKGTDCLVVPKSMRKEVVRVCHEQGHFGRQKTEELVKREFYFEKMQETIASVLQNCVRCIVVNRKQGKQEGLLNPIPKGDVPLATYHIDHLGHLTASKKGYQYVLCVIDGFTKFVWLYPTKTTSVKETIQKLDIQKAVFGNPRIIISDRSTTFTSEEFRSYCEEEGIQQHVITTGVPRGNGQVERINSIIIPVLAKLAHEKPEDWWKFVNSTQRYINNTYNRAIKMSPFELLVGTKMYSPEDIKIREIIEAESIQTFEEKRDEVREKAKAAIDQIQKENRRSFNRRRKEAAEYTIGERVVMRRTQFGAGRKIQPKYLGPYVISKVMNNDRYELVKVGDGEGPSRTSASADLLKKYYTEGSSESDSEGEPVLREDGVLETEQAGLSDEESDFLGFPDDESDTGSVADSGRPCGIIGKRAR